MSDIPHDHYLLTDVLETGVERDGDTVVGTRTQTHTLEIRGGRIAAIHDAPTAPCPDTVRQGMLALPPAATCTSTWTRPSMAAPGRPRCRARARPLWAA